MFENQLVFVLLFLFLKEECLSAELVKLLGKVASSTNCVDFCGSAQIVPWHPALAVTACSLFSPTIMQQCWVLSTTRVPGCPLHSAPSSSSQELRIHVVLVLQNMVCMVLPPVEWWYKLVLVSQIMGYKGGPDLWEGFRLLQTNLFLHFECQQYSAPIMNDLCIICRHMHISFCQTQALGLALSGQLVWCTSLGNI